MTDRELMQKALDALCWYTQHYWRPPEVDEAVAQLGERLERDCYGDGTVYRGVRSKDSATRTVVIGFPMQSQDWKVTKIHALSIRVMRDLVYLKDDEDGMLQRTQVMDLVTRWSDELYEVVAQPDSTTPVVERETLEQALQECEKAYLMKVSLGTPQHCQAHDKAREHFWQTLEHQG